MNHTDLRLTRLTNDGHGHIDVLTHLRHLSDDDLALRFGLARVKDETLVSYVRGLNFERDVVLALRDAPGNIVALAHAARYEVLLTTRREARPRYRFQSYPRAAAAASLIY